MKKLLAILFSFATLVLIPYIIGLLNSATDKYLTDNGISYNNILVYVVIAIVVLVLVFTLVSICISLASQKINITKLSEVVSSYVYNGDPLFEIPREEIGQYSVLTSRISVRVYFTVMQLLGQYPVVYYNVTAKPFLNWIDYLYLNLLNELINKCNAKVIISLHIDETLLSEGVYDELAKEKYIQLKKKASEIIKKVVPSASIKDEYSYYLKSRNSVNNHPEYFIGTIISNINHLVQEIVDGTINYDKFIRKESNILSVMPISVLSHKYRHLFILDYIGSFDIWKMQPYNSLKQRNNILFIACNTIKDKNGDRIPSWNENDGVNFTDANEQIRKKIGDNDRAINAALYEIYTKKSSCNFSDTELQEKCIDEVLQIKHKLNL